MTDLSKPENQPPWAAYACAALIGCAAFVLGLYGRFKGIAAWPLGIDEFYISRSIDNVLRSGLPSFPCGGYYTRGMAFQYTVAALRLFGGTPEWAGRAVAGVSSLLVLPAVYLLGKRLRGGLVGGLVGGLAVVILCVSLWEIEMARFARMYAPFQAVFAWYLVHLVRYAADRRPRSLHWLIGLSVLGVLTWEGGALLGLTNILAVLLIHERGRRLSAAEWRRLAGLSLLLVGFYFATRDFRGFVDPPDAAGAVAEPGSAHAINVLWAWAAPLPAHPTWGLGLLVPLMFCAGAWRWIASWRDRWPAPLGLSLVLGAAAAHCFMAAAGVLVLMLLLGLLDVDRLRARPARYFWLALAAFLAYWTLIDLSSGPASALLERLIGVPDVYDQVLRPWARTLPLLSLGMAAGLAYWCGVAIVERRSATDPVAVLLSVSILLLLAIGATPTDRVETRYTFFLYPVFILLAVSAVASLVQRLAPRTRVSAAVTVAVTLALFGFTEDFGMRHLLEVDSGPVNFRVGMSRVLMDHYYPRNEIRGVADWLGGEVRGNDLVITGIPSLDEYYRHIDYFYLDQGDSRYETYVCADERTDRWTNHRVLYTAASLEPLVATGRRVYLSVYANSERMLRQHAQAAGWSVRRVWSAPYGTASVLLIERPPAVRGT